MAATCSPTDSSTTESSAWSGSSERSLLTLAAISVKASLGLASRRRYAWITDTPGTEVETR